MKLLRFIGLFLALEALLISPLQASGRCSSAPQSAFEESLQCFFCGETQLDPRLLPCGHSFCQECLIKIEYGTDKIFFCCGKEVSLAKTIYSLTLNHVTALRLRQMKAGQERLEQAKKRKIEAKEIREYQVGKLRELLQLEEGDSLISTPWSLRFPEERIQGFLLALGKRTPEDRREFLRLLGLTKKSLEEADNLNLIIIARNLRIKLKETEELRRDLFTFLNS